MYTFRRAQVDLSITKTDGRTQVVPGSSTTYTLVVTNQQNSNATLAYADGAVVTDAVAAGLSKTAVSCVAAGGAVCPAGLTVALIESGATIPTLPPGGTLTFSITATVTATSGSVSNTATVAAPAGYTDIQPADNTATDTDLLAARVTVQKVSLGGVGAFDFTGSNGIAAQTLTTTTAGTAVAGATQVLTTPATSTTITEGTPPAGYVLSGIGCTGLPGGTATPNLATRTVTLDAAATAAGANIVCTFTNSRIPLLRLQKSLPGGRAVAADQFTLNMTGMASLTTTGTGSTATGVLTHSGAAPGSSYTLSETAAGATNLAYYNTAYACANAFAGGQTPSGTGTSFVVTPVAGDDLTCTLSNAALVADLQVVKTASPSGAVQAGRVVTFTILATNNGPAAADGARINDTPVGLDCQTPSATASCTASGGASCPSATVAVSTLVGSGISVPLFPSGGSVSLTLQCTVLP